MFKEDGLLNELKQLILSHKWAMDSHLQGISFVVLAGCCSQDWHHLTVSTSRCLIVINQQALPIGQMPVMVAPAVILVCFWHIESERPRPSTYATKLRINTCPCLKLRPLRPPPLRQAPPAAAPVVRLALLAIRRTLEVRRHALEELRRPGWGDFAAVAPRQGPLHCGIRCLYRVIWSSGTPSPIWPSDPFVDA